MEGSGEMQGYEKKDFMGNDAFPEGLEPDVVTGSGPPTWRGLVIAVIAAIVLSLTATLLLGGSFGVYKQQGSATGCGPGSACCPPAAGS